MEGTSPTTPQPENPKDALRKKLKEKQQQRTRGSTPLPAGIQSQGLAEMFSMVDTMMKENPSLLKDMESKVKQMVDNSGVMSKMEQSLKKMAENGDLEKLAEQLPNNKKSKKNKKKKKASMPKKPPTTIIQEQATSNNLE